MSSHAPPSPQAASKTERAAAGSGSSGGSTKKTKTLPKGTKAALAETARTQKAAQEAASSSSSSAPAPKRVQASGGARVQLLQPTADGGGAQADDEDEDAAAATGDDDDDDDDGVSSGDGAHEQALPEAGPKATRAEKKAAARMERLENNVFKLTDVLNRLISAQATTKPKVTAASVRAARAHVDHDEEDDDDEEPVEPAGGATGGRATSSSDSDGDAESHVYGQRREARARTLQLRQPKGPLSYGNASNPTVVDEFFDTLDVMFRQLNWGRTPADEARKLMELLSWIDRDLRTWWRPLRRAAERAGTPLTFKDFKKLLRAQFHAKRAEQAAIEEFIRVKQTQGEGMDKYLLRAMQLYMRVYRDFPNAGAMQIVLFGVRADEWPHTYAKAERSVADKAITTLEELREYLQTEALAEPKKPKGAPQQTYGAGTGARPAGKQARRLAAVEQILQAMNFDDGEQDEETPPGGALNVNAATTKPPRGPGKPAAGGKPGAFAGTFNGKCRRCDKKGHMAAQCPEPDLRKCVCCGKTGHGTGWICPDRAPGTGAPKN